MIANHSGLPSARILLHHFRQKFSLHWPPKLLFGHKSPICLVVFRIEPSSILKSFFPYFNTSWVKFVFTTLTTVHLWISLTGPQRSYICWKKSENPVNRRFQSIWAKIQDTVGFGGCISSVWGALCIRYLNICIYPKLLKLFVKFMPYVKHVGSHLLKKKEWTSLQPEGSSNFLCNYF